MKKPINPDLIGEKDIAVIGMSGRFPMSENLDQFWKNLRKGVECVTRFTDEELLASGIDASVLQDSNYIKSAPILKDIDKFDAGFFGYSPKEAELLDPQQRLFLELAWEAMEDAGYVPGAYDGLVGVYGSIAWNTYLLSNLCSNRELFQPGNDFQVFTANDKDFMSTRVAYKLNLKGPSMVIQTACSSSLVGIHLAGLSLLNYECDIALAGGCTIKVPQKAGYYYQEGLLGSPDGHCRAFDDDAHGTIFGSGAGIVALKRLSEAIEDGDNIYAVIKGSAINNDGSIKVSYTAPSVEGQAEVIAEAQAVAGIDAETISYVETHGTGTSLGDPIEVAALNKVFTETTSKTGFCSIGSVKTNVGHLDAASGAAGFIKTAMALQHEEIPPSINFEKPNSKIDFENSPFFVNSTLRNWERTSVPRRAGVSSFGVGGTNAHVILEEAPECEPSRESGKNQLLVLSAKSAPALEKATANLAEFLKNNPESNLSDVAYTLKVGRAVFRHRRIVACGDLKDAVSAMERLDPSKVFTGEDLLEPRQRPVAFMFTGQGSQYVNMGLELYQKEPVFRENIDKCCTWLKPYLGMDLRELIFAPEGASDELTEKLGQTSFTQPALFVMEYSMAMLFMDWGIQPQSMIGHSIGEYVAACVAGVFSPEDALMLVAKRGKLMQSLPAGSMMAVSLPEADVKQYIKNNISIAAVNSPSLCVLSGTDEAIDGLEQELSVKGIGCRRLHTSHAFHSSMMDPILESFKECFKGIKMQAPAIPYISNLTGTWIKDSEATSPDYWAKHLRNAVLFSEGIQKLCRQQDAILLEMGPGQTLSTLAKQHLDAESKIAIVNTIRHPRETRSDMDTLLLALGKLWVAGLEINWNIMYENEDRCRVSLPTYPFERQSYWIEPGRVNYSENELSKGFEKLDKIEDWFYVPSWKCSFVPEKFAQQLTVKKTERWLIFMDKYGLGDQMADILKAHGCFVVKVSAGEKFIQVSDNEFSLNCGDSADYNTLLQTLGSNGGLPEAIVHLWSMNDMQKTGDKEVHTFAEVQKTGFYSMLYLVQALEKMDGYGTVRLSAVSNNTFNIGCKEFCCPGKATLPGLCKIISQEYSGIVCRFIDTDIMPQWDKAFVKRLLGEILLDSHEKEIAIRKNKRWVKSYVETGLEKNDSCEIIRQDGIYIITGGINNTGFEILKYMSKRTKGRIIVIDEMDFPHENEWENWLGLHDKNDWVSLRIGQLQALKQDGPEIAIIRADIANKEQLAGIVNDIRRQGGINGVIHAVDVSENDIFGLIDEIDTSKCEKHFKTKVHIMQVINDSLNGLKLDFAIAVSSIASVVGGLGYSAYAASNAFIDAFANESANNGNVHWTSINLDAWKSDSKKDMVTDFSSSLSELAMTSGELEEVFDIIFSHTDAEQLIVSTASLDARIDKISERNHSDGETEDGPGQKSAAIHPRPNLATPYAAPENQLEQTIADLWAKAFGLDRVGVNDNFFDLGGDSLIAIQVVNQIKKHLKQDVPAVSLYQSPNIRGMAQLLQQDESQSNEERAAEFEAQKDKMNRRKQMQQRKRQSKTDKDGEDNE
jgi:acyl transferase domain-containing protein/acyl carrier protein